MKKICVLLTLLFSLQIGFAQDKKASSFNFIVFGDMPYFLPEDYARFENLIKTVNAQNQVFNVHVGDIKSGSTPCTQELYQKVYDYFGQFKKPLVYTPGDNEWTDCNREKAGSYDPEERLAVIRKMFFPTNKSFGKEQITYISQSENPTYSKFVENNRWEYNTVAFATIHLVGTNNNFVPDSKNFNKEFYERDKANIAWMQDVFAQAKKNGNSSIVLFTQADMFNADKGASGFDHILKELKRLTIDFAKPVLLINGDSHKFLVDKPFIIDEKSKKVVPNFTRMQVFGEQDIHAVKVTFNPASSNLFQIEELLIPGN